MKYLFLFFAGLFFNGCGLTNKDVEKKTEMNTTNSTSNDKPTPEPTVIVTPIPIAEPILNIGSGLCSIENGCLLSCKTTKVITEMKVFPGGITGIDEKKNKEIEIKITGEDENKFFDSLAELKVPLILPEETTEFSVVSSFNVIFGSPSDYVEFKKIIRFMIHIDDIAYLPIPASAIPVTQTVAVGGAEVKYIKDYKTTGWMGITTLLNAENQILSVLRASKISRIENNMAFDFSIIGKGRGIYLKTVLLYSNPESIIINGKPYSEAPSRTN